jgi:hypothetical protein
MSTATTTIKISLLEIIQKIICSLCTHYNIDEVKRMWQLICQDRKDKDRKMTNNNNEKNNVINIDSNLYEELSVMAMRQGYDDVTKFINNLLE